MQAVILLIQRMAGRNKTPTQAGGIILETSLTVCQEQDNIIPLNTITYPGQDDMFVGR